MGHNEDIWLGDLVRAIHKLKPNGEVSNAAIAGLLGFNWCGPQKLFGPSSSSDKDVPQLDQKQTLPKPEPIVKPPLDVPPPFPSNKKSQALKKLLEPSKETESQSKGLANPWETQKPLDEVTERHLADNLPYEPLFKASWSREIIAAIAAKRLMAGRVDTKQLVRTVAQGAPIERIPQLPTRTLTRGVQLLVDNGVAMEPFRRDQTHLAEMLKGVVGESLVEELSFSDCPNRGCFDPQSWREIRYRLPAPGTPVLVLSNMGIGGPYLHREQCSVLEWTQLYAQLAQRNCRLIALVPYPEHRWIPWLSRIIAHIPWDRSTSLSRVLEILE